MKTRQPKPAAPAPAAPIWVERGTGTYRRISIALFLAGFVTFTLVYDVQPLLPEFATDFQVSAATSSLALSVTTACLAIAILCAGAGSEMFGRRKLMFVSMGLASFLNIAQAVVPDWHALLFIRALEGIVLGGVPAVAMAYLAEEIHPKGLGMTMGLYISGTAFGGMAGRVLSGVIAEHTSWRWALGTIGVIDLLMTFAFIMLLPPSRNFQRQVGFDARFHLQAWGRHLRDAGLPFLFLIGCLSMGAFITIYNYAAFRLVSAPYELNQTQLGLIFTVYLFGIVASSTAGAMVDRIGRAPVLLTGLAVMLAGIGVTLLQPLVLVITGISLVTIGFFISHSVASGWVGRMAKTTKGHAASLYLLAYYTGSSVAGWVGGWFWAAEGWLAVAAFTAVMVACGLAAALHLARTHPG
ncbi:MFS transporter [Afipia carboxidovorans]|uniref:MFS transporter n=1 Tax=Afipia carboxidovorans TaxID=40137 RepID=UPI00308E3678|nr:MFS transporter [Afipia carboxidovorans]